MSWLLLALLSALSASIVSPVRKLMLGNLRPITILWMQNFLVSPLYIILILYFGLPSLAGDFGIILAAIVLLEIISNLLLFYALKIEELSVVIPLLALSPAFAYFINIFLLNSPFNFYGITGIFLVVLGSFFVNLNFKEKKWGFKLSLGSFLSVIVAFLWAFGTAGIVIGIRSSNILSFVSAVNLLMTIILLGIDMIILKSAFPKDKIFKLPNLALNFFGLLSWVGEFTAVSMIAQPAYVSAIKKMDVFLSIIYGKLFWKEKHFLTKLLASFVIISGIIIIIFLG